MRAMLGIDGRQVAANRGDLQTAHGAGGEVASHHLRRGGQRDKPVFRAPGIESAPITLVRFYRIGGGRLLEKLAGLVDDRLQGERGGKDGGRRHRVWRA